MQMAAGARRNNSSHCQRAGSVAARAAAVGGDDYTVQWTVQNQGNSQTEDAVLFDQVYLDALIRGGQWGEAQNILQQRVTQQPESLRLATLLAGVYRNLGIDPALASL